MNFDLPHISALDPAVADAMKSELNRQRHTLEMIASEEQLSANVFLMPQTPQFISMNTILQDPATEQVDFVFYFDRLACLLIEKCVDPYVPAPEKFKFGTDHNIGLIGPWTVLGINR